jgi:prepilin-type N-terminal cleavage/methylation domain-containing protein
MVRILQRRRSRAFGLIEVLMVSAIMSSLSSQTGGFQYAIDKAKETQGLSNLQQIYLLLMAQTTSGPLPDAAFYPKDDPKKDPKSILNRIEGAPAELFISPFAPDALKRKGLTYAWNDTVNGKDMSTLPKDTWLLIDMAAFIADPAMPAPQKYLLLYADGRAVAVNSLPSDIQQVVKDARAKIEAESKAKSAK